MQYLQLITDIFLTEFLKAHLSRVVKLICLYVMDFMEHFQYSS